MANYKGVVRHVRYWRGEIQKWSTVYPFSGSGTALNSAACDTLLAADSAMCYGETGFVAGGIWQVEFYNASGGVPIVSKTYFDPEVPGGWINYTATGWSLNKTRTTNNVAENALGVRWPAGLSDTGKAVYFRKWFHAVPSSIPASVGAVDIISSEITSLTTAATALQGCLASGYGLSLGNARTLAGTPLVSAFYENHQMPRGRRRKALVTASGRYTGPTIDIPGGFPPVEED